jgi:hypothetical protein
VIVKRDWRLVRISNSLNSLFQTKMLYLNAMKLGIERRRTMLKRTPMIVLFIMLGTVALLFAATNGYSCTCAGTPPTCAECTPDRAERGECFTYSGTYGNYIVEIIPELGTGNFPWTVAGNSVFKYKICQPTPTRNISHINIKIPETCGLLPIPASGYPLPGEWITAETGESSTKWASNDMKDDVYKFYLTPSFCYGEIALTMTGNVYADKKEMLLKISSTSPWPVGEILGPSCLAPTPGFTTDKRIDLPDIPDAFIIAINAASNQVIKITNLAGTELGLFSVTDFYISGGPDEEPCQVEKISGDCMIQMACSPACICYTTATGTATCNPLCCNKKCTSPLTPYYNTSQRKCLCR